MLGGGHVRRLSVGSIIEASPCVRVEKRKHSGIQHVGRYESPHKARIVEKPSIASTSSFQFGGERMIRAQHGLLERQSLEESCLIADGEDISNLCKSLAASLNPASNRLVDCPAPVFTRPGPASRSRSSTCTSSSGGDTPPLSTSDGSSMSEGSQSSIDLSQINIALSNVTHPLSNVARHRTRARARGAGHRRRYSKAHMSRASVYETIEEELSSSTSSSSAQSLNESPTCQPVFIVDSDTASVHSKSDEVTWDDEHGIVALRKFYALRDEAVETVTESKRMWMDTPFSLFAVQCACSLSIPIRHTNELSAFQAPNHPAGMQALLEHSVQNYGPLPSELRPRRVRSRTSSRPSPYPPNRFFKITTISPEKTTAPVTEVRVPTTTPALRQVPVNTNTLSVAPSIDALKPFSPLAVDIEPKRENAFGLAPNVRPRVGSTARRTALGWSKRSTGKASTDQKENVIGNGSVMTCVSLLSTHFLYLLAFRPGDNLRLNRPRPKGRPTPGGRTPASHNRSIRV